MAEEISETKNRPRRRILRIAAWCSVVGIVLIIILAVAVRIYFSDERVRQLVIDTADQALGQPGTLTIDRLHLSLLSGVNLEGIEMNDPSAKHSPPLLSIKSVKVEWGLASLLKRAVAIEKIVVDQPSVVLIQKSGKWNFDFLVPPPSKTTPKPSAAPAGFPDIPFDIRIDALEVKGMDARLKIDDEIDASIKGLDLEAKTYLDAETTKLSHQQHLKIGEIVSKVKGLPQMNLSYEQRDRFELMLSTGNLALLGTEVSVSDFLKLKFTGMVEAYGQKGFELNGINTEIDLPALIRWLPTEFREPIKTLETDARLSAVTNIRGKLPTADEKNGKILAAGTVKMNSTVMKDESLKTEISKLSCTTTWKAECLFPEFALKNVSLASTVAIDEADVLGLVQFSGSKNQVHLTTADLFDESILIKFENENAFVVVNVPPIKARTPKTETAITLEAQNLEEFTKGYFELTAGKFTVTDSLSTTFSAAVTEWGKIFNLKLGVEDFDLSTADRYGISALHPDVSSLKLKGKASATIQLSGSQPTEKQLADFALPIDVDLTASISNLGVQLSGLDVQFQKIAFSFSHDEQSEIKLRLKVGQGKVAASNSKDNGLSQLTLIKNLGLPSFEAIASPSATVTITGKVPSPAQILQLSLPLTASVEIGTSLRCSVLNIAPDFSSVGVDCESMKYRLSVRPPNAAGSQDVDVFLEHNPLSLTFDTKIMELGKTRLQLPALTFNSPFSLNFNKGLLQTTGEGISYVLGRLITGSAVLSLDEFGAKSFSIENEADVSLSETVDLLPSVLETILKAKVRVEGTAKLKTSATFPIPGDENSESRQIMLKLDGGFEINSVEYGKDLAARFQGPLKAGITTKVVYDQKDERLKASGQATCSFAGLSVNKPLKTSISRFTAELPFELNHKLTESFPAAKLSGKVLLAGLDAPETGTVGTSIFEMQAATEPGKNHVINLGFSTRINDLLSAPVGGVTLPPLSAKIESKSTTVNARDALINSVISVRVPELGEDFLISINSKLSEWAQKFDLELEVTGVDLEHITQTIPLPLLASENEDEEPPLAAEGKVEVSFKAIGQIPNAEQLESMKLPIDLNLGIEVSDGLVTYYSAIEGGEEKTEEDPENQAAGEDEDEDKDEYEDPPAMIVELGNLNINTRIKHVGSSGRANLVIKTVKDAELYYEDPLIEEAAFPATFQCELDVTELADPKADFKSFTFAVGDFLQGNVTGTVRPIDFRDTHLSLKATADLPKLVAGLPEAILKLATDSVGAIDLSGIATMQAEVKDLKTRKDGLPDLAVAVKFDADIESLEAGTLLYIEPLELEAEANTTVSLQKGEVGEVTVEGKVNIEQPAILGQVYADRIPIAFRMNLEAKTLDRLSSAVTVSLEQVTYESDDLDTPPIDGTVETAGSLNLNNMKLDVSPTSVKISDWLYLKPLTGTVKQLGESFQFNLKGIRVDLPAGYKELAGLFSKYLPRDLTVRGSVSDSSLELGARVPVEKDYSEKHLPVLLRALLNGAPPYIPTKIAFEWKSPATTFSSKTAGIEIEAQKTSAQLQLSGDDLSLKGEVQMPRFRFFQYLGSTEANPRAQISLGISQFDEARLSAAFNSNLKTPQDSKSRAVTRSVQESPNKVSGRLDLRVGGLSTLHRGEEFLLDEPSLAAYLSSQASGRFELILPEPTEIIPNLFVNGLVRVFGEASLRPAKEINLDAQLFISPKQPLNVQYADLIGINGLRCKIPFRKTYRIISSDGNPTELSTHKKRVSDLPFAAQFHAYREDFNKISLDSITALGQTVLKDFEASIKFSEGVLDIDQLQMNLLGGDVTGQATAITDGSTQNLQVRVEFAGVGSVPLRGKPKPGGGINGDLFLNISIGQTEDGSMADVSKIDGSLHITKMGRDGLHRLLDILDPNGSDPNLNTVRLSLRFGKPKSVIIEIRHGKMRGKVTHSLPVIGDQDTPFEVPVKRITQTKTMAPAMKTIQIIQSYLSQFSAETIEFKRGGGVKFR